MTDIMKYSNINERELSLLKQTYIQMSKMSPTAVKALSEDENLIVPVMAQAFLMDYLKRVSISFFKFQITQRDIGELKLLQDEMTKFLKEEPEIVSESLDHGFLYFVSRFDTKRRISRFELANGIAEKPAVTKPAESSDEE